jgi:MFS family permease
MKTHAHQQSSMRDETLETTLRSFPRPIWILFAGVFLNKFGTFVIPFLTLYLTRQGFSPREAGAALGAYGLGRLGAAFIGGHLADTLGRRKTIVLSMISAAVTMLLLSQARSLPVIVLLTGLASLTGELYLPACGALLADLVPPHQRITAYAAYRISFNAGWVFGPATAAFLASHSFQWLFVGDAVTSLLFGIVAWKWLPRGVRSQQNEAGWVEAWNTLRADRRLHQLGLATLLIGLSIHQLVSTFGLHLSRLGFSDVTYGVLLSFNGLLVVIFELPLITRSRRWSSRYVMAVGYLLMGLGLALNTTIHTLPAIVLAMVVFTAGEMFYAPVAGAYVAGLAPPRLRGRYMGTWGFANSLSLAIAPNLGMMIFDWSPALLWTSCGFISVLAALTMLWEVRPREQFIPTTVSVPE